MCSNLIVNLVKSNSPSFLSNIKQMFPNVVLHKKELLTNDIFCKTKNVGKNIGIIFEKIINPTTQKVEKIPVNVDVDRINLYPNLVEYSYSKDGKQIGFSTFSEYRNIEKNYRKTSLLKDYPEYGIIGDRLIITELYNCNPEKYSGIGSLSDQVAIEHCLQRGIPTVIIAEAGYNSHAAHFLRGRKFIDISNKDYDLYHEFLVQYGESNPNIIIKNIIEKTPEGQMCNTEKLGMLINYMPKEIVEKYMQKIATNPILAPFNL